MGFPWVSFGFPPSTRPEDLTYFNKILSTNMRNLKLTARLILVSTPSLTSTLVNSSSVRTDWSVYRDTTPRGLSNIAPHLRIPRPDPTVPVFSCNELKAFIRVRL